MKKIKNRQIGYTGSVSDQAIKDVSSQMFNKSDYVYGIDPYKIGDSNGSIGIISGEKLMWYTHGVLVPFELGSMPDPLRAKDYEEMNRNDENIE